MRLIGFWPCSFLKFILLGLNQEIKTFKNETARVQEVKRKLECDKEKLSKELKEFEQLREYEIKKIEEEKRKLRRDKLLLDKANRESTYSKNLKCSNCEENKSKAERLLEDLRIKEIKWNAVINQLKKELLQLESEKSAIESENLELKHLAVEGDDEEEEDCDCGPDSGFRSQQMR